MAVLTLIAVAAATIAARLPFLLRADRFFDSDEAVEGLMARHVFLGEYPLFLWGQRYKGVPEVYLTGAVFHWIPQTAASVVALKSVTLACFAAFVCLNFALLTRTCSRTVAWIATAFLIACPPSLVLWSLSGSAEIVMTFVAGAVLCLGVDAWRRRGSQGGVVVASAALGVGLWVQQFILYYVIALALTHLVQTPDWRKRLHEAISGRSHPTWIRFTVQLPLAIAAVHAALGLVAFLTGDFEAAPFGAPVTATPPQKMWWIAAGWLLAAISAVAAGHIRRAHVAPAIGFLAGYSPAIIGHFVSSGREAPVGHMDLAGLRSSIPPIAHDVLPILFGFKSPTTGRLDVPAWSAVIIAIVLVVSYIHIRRRPYTPFFHIFLLTTPIVFIASGAFIDAQSYRYLMPVYAALPVVYAVGIDGALRANKMAGMTLLTGLLALFVLEQVDWYRQTEPDRESATIVECLDRAGIRAAFADYWLSYKLMFLTGERITLAPMNGVDRYAPYTATVRAQPSPPTIERPRAASVEPISCRAVIRDGERTAPSS